MYGHIIAMNMNAKITSLFQLYKAFISKFHSAELYYNYTSV